MGLQQSKVTNKREKIIELSSDMTLCKTMTDKLDNDQNSDQRSKKFIVYNLSHRRTHGLLEAKLKNKTIYLYWSANSKGERLIKTIDLTDSEYDLEYLFNSICMSNDETCIGIPEIDPETGLTIYTIYGTDQLIKTRRLRLIRSVRFESKNGVIRLFSKTLHQIMINYNGSHRTKIVSYDLENSRFDRKLVVESAEKLRFSMTGRIIGTYGLLGLNVYGPKESIDPDYQLLSSTKLVYSNRYELVDLIVTDRKTVYYVLTDREYMYHCVTVIGSSHNRIIDKTLIDDQFIVRTDERVDLTLRQIHPYEYGGLFVPDLDFYSSDSKLVRLQNLVVLSDVISDKIVVRILAEMSDNSTNSSTNTACLSSISLIGTHAFKIGESQIYRFTDTHVYRRDRNRILVHDLTKVIGPTVSIGLAKLIRDQIRVQIQEESPKALRLVKKIGSESPPSSIVVRAADERDTTYEITSSIARYSILISSIYDGLSRKNRSADPPVYQVTVNSNMTLMDIKSYEVFENLLDGKIQPTDVVDKIFDHYPRSSYDRYQTTIEILDHIYDYTKFVLLDIDLSANEVLDQIFSLYKKRVALLVAYLCSAIVMDYYNREIDLPHCLVETRQIRRSTDFEMTDAISQNFHHNFQPFKSVIESHLRLLNL